VLDIYHPYRCHLNGGRGTEGKSHYLKRGFFKEFFSEMLKFWQIIFLERPKTFIDILPKNC
jgi:hypothetical protein